MRCEAIATDIDGTLLDKNGHISKKTHETLSLLMSKGIHIFLCSARPPFTIFPIVQKLRIKSPFIAYNGGQVLEKNGAKLLRSKYISPSLAKEIIFRLRGLTSATNVYIDNNWYVDNFNFKVEAEARLVKYSPKIVNDWNDIVQRKPVSKILFFHKTTSLPEINNVLLKYSKRIEFETSKTGYLEVLPLNAKKSIALKKLAAIYKISPRSIIAIGDNYNDIDMFKIAGYSIALDNSPIEVKNNADWVSSSNDNDGFYYAVNRIYELGFIF